jgi:hypothetical protein
MLGKSKDMKIPEPTAVKARTTDISAAAADQTAEPTVDTVAAVLSPAGGAGADAFSKCILPFIDHISAAAVFAKLRGNERADKQGRPTKKVNLGGEDHCFVAKCF